MTLYYYSDFDNYAGIENYGYNLIFLLRKYNPSLKIVVLSESEKCIYETSFIEMGCTVYNLGFSAHKPLSFSKKLRAIFDKASKDDIIQLNICSMRNVILLNACKNSGLKTIVVSHYSKPKGKFQLLHYLSRLIFKNKFINVAVSDEAGRFMFSDSSFLVVPNVVNVDNFSFSFTGRNDVRSNLGLNNNDLLLGLVGRVSKEKNQKFAIRVVNKINDPSIKMVILGKGDISSLNNTIRKEIKNNIYFCSSEPSKMCDWYSAFDLLIVPSKHESFSLVKYEGLANGLDVFVSNGVPKNRLESNKVKCLNLRIDEWVREISLFKNTYMFSTRKNENDLSVGDSMRFLNSYLEIYRK